MNLLNIVEKMLSEVRNQSKDKPKVCKCCGETLGYSNTIFRLSKKEYNFSGLCEECFAKYSHKGFYID